MIEYFYTCPYCWQPVSILVDGALDRFEGIEDCEVCCNPIEFRILLVGGEVVSFSAVKAQ